MATSGSGTMAVNGGSIVRRWKKDHVLQGVEKSKHRVLELQKHVVIHGGSFCFGRACLQVVTDECGWESFLTGWHPYDFDGKLDTDRCWVGSPPPTLEDWAEEGLQLIMLTVTL